MRGQGGHHLPPPVPPFVPPVLFRELARFILETDDPSRRIIRLTDHPSNKYKQKTNYPDKLRKKVVRLIIRLCINAGKQTDHPSRRTTRANPSEQTNYVDSSS